jgi:glutathione S-transferase
MSDVVIHELRGAWGLPSISPFCLKLQTWLRIAGIPYSSVVDATPFKAPKGKLPFIEHHGRRIVDSGFAIEYLSQHLGRDPDASLHAVSRGLAVALRRMVEENLYWTLVYDRWMVEENWRSFRDVVLGGVPAAVRPLVAPIARRGVRKQLVGHGIGIHSAEEIHAIGRRDVGALADVLGDQPFFFGDAPTGFDAVAYGFLANILEVPIASPVKDEGLRRANLPAYLARMRSRFWPARRAEGAVAERSAAVAGLG